MTKSDKEHNDISLFYNSIYFTYECQFGKSYLNNKSHQHISLKKRLRITMKHLGFVPGTLQLVHLSKITPNGPLHIKAIAEYVFDFSGICCAPMSLAFFTVKNRKSVHQLV